MALDINYAALGEWFALEMKREREFALKRLFDAIKQQDDAIARLADAD